MSIKINNEIVLLILLLVISIVVRLQFAYPLDFDSYWIHGYKQIGEDIRKLH